MKFTPHLRARDGTIEVSPAAAEPAAAIHNASFSEPSALARRILSWVLPLDFPLREPLDEDHVLRLVSRARLSEFEATGLWCYLHLIAQLDADAAPRASAVMEVLGLLVEDQRHARSRLAGPMRSLGPDFKVRDLVEKPGEPITRAITELAVDTAQRARRPRRHLPHLVAGDFQHPEDTTGLEALRALPFLPGLLTKVADFCRRRAEIGLLGNGVSVDQGSYASLHAVYEEACQTLGLTQPPPLYVAVGGMRVYSQGIDAPMIVVESMAASLFDEAEMGFVLGRELGHVLSGHTRMLTVAQVMSWTADAISGSTLGVGGLAFQAAFGWRLNRWCRYAEMSADRAGFLTCQNREVALQALCKLSGFPTRHGAELSTRAFVRQVREYNQRLACEQVDAITRDLRMLTTRAPDMAQRVEDLLQWAESPACARILCGRPGIDGRGIRL